jgi:hypothetical protein
MAGGDATSTGVRLVAALTVLRGFFGFFDTTTLLALSGTATGLGATVALVFAGLVALSSFVQLFAGAGLWIGSWAGWAVATVVFGLNVVVGAVSVAVFGPTGGGVATLALDAVVFAYLLVVRGRFGANDQDRDVPDVSHR